MSETTVWWQSKTLWVQFVSLAFVLLNSFGALPADLNQEDVLLAVMGAVNVLTIITRSTGSGTRITGTRQ